MNVLIIVLPTTDIRGRDRKRRGKYLLAAILARMYCTVRSTYGIMDHHFVLSIIVLDPEAQMESKCERFPLVSAIRLDTLCEIHLEGQDNKTQKKRGRELEPGSRVVEFDWK